MDMTSRPFASRATATTMRPEVAVPAVAMLPLPEMLLRRGPFPAVTRVEGQTGDWDHVGATRLIHLSDGGTVRETVVEYAGSSGFAYDLEGFTDIFGRIVHGVRGEWTAAAGAGGTDLRWTWRFDPRPGWGLFARYLLAPAWGLYMRWTIDRMVRILEARTA